MRTSGLGRTPGYVLTGGLAIIFMFPLLWAAVASVSPQGGTAQADGFGFGNYTTLFDYGAGLPQYVTNSVIVSVLTVVITLSVSILGGYAFARFVFPGRDVLFLVTLSILMVPYATLLIPLYVLLKALGLQNSLLGLSLVLAVFQLPFATFMMRISFDTVPREIEESALVDGCGTFAVLRRIMLPAVRPGMITVGLFAFLAAWNDFIAPLILLSDDKKAPLPLAIATLRQQTMGVIDYGATEAGVIVMAIPCLLLFFLLQGYYVRGFMSGAVKGVSAAGALGRTPSYVLTAGLAILFLFPLIWSLIASVSPQGGTKQVNGYGLGNYVTLLNYGNGAPLYFLNSVIVSTLTVALTIGISLLGGYAFARFTFPGRDLVFLLTLAILMVPLGSLLIPLYVLLNFLGQQNSLVGLAFVLTLFQLPFATFMMRISFEAVPIELEESALVDGAGTLQTLRSILPPAVRPAIVTVGLFAFLAAWNDFIAPLILINDDKKSPLPLAIATLRQQTSFTVDYGATEAGVVVMAVPCLLLFVFLQRFYVRGFMSGAVKG